ncbi:SapC family protein [Hirschia litorea]|uniref:SapC family protein n=1 Tax=Hirschia litorea TaxID=1199156 RepID=A0ABW2IP51_9PROT
MPNSVMLSKDTHLKTRVITDRGSQYGEGVHIVPVLATELRSLVLDFPICLLKDGETGQFGLYAFLGFDAGENLFLQGDKWTSSYVPLNVRRQPFMVGFSQQEGETENAVVTIDMDSPRVQEEAGEALFTEEGEPTQFLKDVEQLLSNMVAGSKATEVFIKSLIDHELVEPIKLNVTFNNGEEKSYDGMYTVNEEKLAKLDAGPLQELHAKGYLQASYHLLSSMGHIRKLIEYKNAL